jgi:hypothetical protein
MAKLEWIIEDHDGHSWHILTREAIERFQRALAQEGQQSLFPEESEVPTSPDINQSLPLPRDTE